MGISRMASIARWSALSVALLLPAGAHSESWPRIVGVDTEHIFGFTEGTDIGYRGEIELESTFVGRFGKPGSFAALENETAVRYGITDSFRIAVGTLFDYRSIYNVPDLDDYSGFNFAGLTAEARWQVLKRDSSPIGLTLSATPQWRRVGDLSVPPVESYSIVLTLLADAALIPDTTFAAVNLTSGIHRWKLPPQSHTLSSPAFSSAQRSAISRTIVTGSSRGTRYSSDQACL
jgi:hypothetical protein